MRAAYLVLPALACLILAYRYYSAFLAAKVMALDDRHVTPAHTQADGHNHHVTSKWVLFGHHFAAIAGPGPLIGPVLAAQFGFMPGLLWLVAGVCLAGAVHDMISLWGSTRRKGASLATIARMEISPLAGFIAAIAILFIIVIALAGVGVPTVLGIIGLAAAVIIGRPIAASSWAPMLTLTKHQLVIALGIYGFLASVLPVWVLLTPRDYLSAFMKIGMILFLVVGVIIVNPVIHMPAVTEYVSGGGPIVPGPLFPFAFITIACGAISGFHSLIATGTTPKMIDKDRDIRPIGYGAMLMEGLVGIMALVAVCTLNQGDYFAINTPPAVYATLDQHVVELPNLEAQVRENVAGRADGAVSLAIGMAQVLSRLPGMSGLMDYWYHFAIMFEALFILTVIDAGTRVGRFLVGELLGRTFPPLARPDWIPGAALTTTLIVLAWGYFIWTGSISTIWPMFGVANQLLACVALSVGTTILVNKGKVKYVWATLVPLMFLTTTTLTAGWMSVQNNFWVMATGPNEALHVTGYIQTFLTLTMMVLVVVILATAVHRWLAVGRTGRDTEALGEPA